MKSTTKKKKKCKTQTMTQSKFTFSSTWTQLLTVQERENSTVCSSQRLMNIKPQKNQNHAVNTVGQDEHRPAVISDRHEEHERGCLQLLGFIPDLRVQFSLNQGWMLRNGEQNYNVPRLGTTTPILQ